MCSAYRKQARNVSLITSVESRLLSDLVLADQGQELNEDGDSIAIVGGELFNKGAQAMTFTVVDQMTKRYPEKDVYLLSGRDYERDQNEKDQYAFDILPWGPEVQLSLLSPELNPVNTKSYSKRAHEAVRSVVTDCSMLIDINGFALSSQMGAKTSFTYLTNIVLAKEYDVPMYVFPQSIGPFEYSTEMKLFLNPLIQTYLTFPQIVCPREQAGVEALAPYTQSNVQREFDIVLQTEDYDLDNIYISKPDFERKDLKSDAVGIVPNSKVFDRADDEEIYSLYEEAIGELLDTGRSIYIFRHSIGDLDICRNIKDRFDEMDDVRLFEDDFDAPELEQVIDQCDFLIASRYHSIVHAYKHGVPVIAIGWAVKYEELLDEFGQSEYFYEGRDRIDTDAFVDSIGQMSEKWEHESESVQEKLKMVRRNDLFSQLFEN
ncbi:polysaccharide pyruvyl transferase family protein [Halorubrum sp. 48-1-W]|uniref:polysaccharide pyruvyl transferase family protein n=1 Tax=Halorubrum sp. 48-1-W TaxID=2249761 RepID=UPI0013003414|nr:polysaccharide pyruvyl transferase family protein [Halorubrum sp. 48-1-W]